MNNQFEKKDALMEKLIACTKSENYKIKEGLKDTHSEVRNVSLKSLRKIYNERKETEFFQKWLYEIESLRKIS